MVHYNLDSTRLIVWRLARRSALATATVVSLRGYTRGVRTYPRADSTPLQLEIPVDGLRIIDEVD